MSEFLEITLLLALIVIGAKLFGYLASKINLPMVVGEISFGIILGPSIINIMALHFGGQPLFVHHESSSEIIKIMAELGVLFLMFLAGLETDLVAMRKVGVAAFNSAVGGVILPFVGGIGTSLLFGMPMREAIFIGTILTATSVSISAQTLIELNKLRTKEGATILGAAVIDDVIGILMLSVVVAVFATGGGAPPPIWLVALKMIGYFAVAVVLAPVAKKFLAWFSKLPVSEPLLAGALVIALLYAFAGEHWGGVAAITGSYLAGIILATGEWKHELEEKSQAVVYSLFVPIFFVDIGLRANLREALTGNLAWVGLIIVLVAILGKIVGSGIGAKLSGFNIKESLRVGSGMVSRGEVGLIVAGIGLEQAVISEEVFSLMVLMVVATTLITPILLRLSFAGKD